MPLLYYTEAHWAGHCPTLGPILCYLLNGSIVGGPRTGSPGQAPIPSPLPRTARASAGPVFKGVCKQFSRSQGHGFITPENGSEDIFVHVSE